MTTLARTVDLLEKLIAFPTISPDSNLAMIAFMADHLGQLGARVTTYSAPCGTKANLFATLGPEGDGGIVLSGHSDVVPVTDQDWTSDPFTLTDRDGLLFGRGTCDMKGFIAATLAMAEAYAALPLTRPVHFAFTHDEETGCIGAQALVKELQAQGLKPAIAIIGEPTEMRIIEGHKGCCEYTTRFTGLEGHGSQPERGVNAAEYAVRYVTKLMELRSDLMARAPEGSRFEPPYTTVNIGRIAGGVAPNVIVGKAEVDWEFRPVQDSDYTFVHKALDAYTQKTLLPAMRAVHPAADIEVETLGEVAGLMPMEENEARDLCAALTGGNGVDVVAFGTEAGLFQQLGMSAVVCGPGSIAQAHKPDEFIAPDQLQACLNMLDGLGKKLTA
ncbi:acetylornithine deacetylase [uncultured Lentibacter sp.]|uniref:acetylornithine deacetylase n=1 Tax=uncultured Lentibacter sp. TaxID=1659309 RepID=UPI0026055519|nr:acetylornithine deacetylase [uncultured Lentibacter sp.]